LIRSQGCGLFPQPFYFRLFPVSSSLHSNISQLIKAINNATGSIEDIGESMPISDQLRDALF
jgi:hypothetical protein